MTAVLPAGPTAASSRRSPTSGANRFTAWPLYDCNRSDKAKRCDLMLIECPRRAKTVEQREGGGGAEEEEEEDVEEEQGQGCHA